MAWHPDHPLDNENYTQKQMFDYFHWTEILAVKGTALPFKS